MEGKTALERAFELADQGVPTADIRTMILREGYDLRQLHGRTISIQLGKRILAASGKTAKGLTPKRGT